MAELTFNVERLQQMETAALVKINGSIDAKTVVLFQEKLDQFQLEGYTRFILDMEGIKYVNSTGLGTLVNVADELETKGGGIALIKIHPKVKVVFDMLGLNAFFKIYSNEEEALSHFQKSDKDAGKGSPVSTASTGFQEIARPPRITQTRSITQQPPSTHSAPVSSPINNILTTKVNPPSEPGAPFSLICAICKVKLNIPKPGSYKCPRCATFFKLFEDGRVTFSERKKTSPLQMKLSCTDECMHGLAEFVAVLATRIGFSTEDVLQLKDAIFEVCSVVMEKAYDNKQYLSYNVVITPSSLDLKVQISDYGKYIYDDNVFPKTSKTMDEFEHTQHPKGGNIISFAKSFNKKTRSNPYGI
ncbi:MAG TPA: anti-sigma factor antagonist [Planctomycetota bacterium]|nr:anti-sigma factor antagonist [Planctomycetota bacterium]HPY74935.1 anti-sigma factor antagonist [Planctomycetota bacterium]HQB00627.1 anti-sigma factor antagonist [Planctomycetota bacterium]